MKLALVGFHGSELDIGILADVIQILDLEEVEPDLIDLRLGRDFLKENKTYDIVVLNYIYLPEVNNSNSDFKRMKGDYSFKVSELQSRENWRKRLIETGAAQILIFGYSVVSEITGEYIGELEGYKLTVKQDKFGGYWYFKLKGIK